MGFLAPLTVILAGGLVVGLAAFMPEMFRSKAERVVFALLGLCGVVGGCLSIVGLP